MDANLRNPARAGQALVVASAAAGLIVSIYDYFLAPGIDGTPGALLVVVSTALGLGAALFIASFRTSPRWLRVVVGALILLDLIGTAAAAYFLEAYLLLALMALGLVGWFVANALTPPRQSPATQTYSEAYR